MIYWNDLRQSISPLGTPKFSCVCLWPGCTLSIGVFGGVKMCRL